MQNKTQTAGVHGIVNGGFRLIQGGQFEHGFMAGFFSSLSGSGVGMIKIAPMGLYAIVGAATGGTAEALGGGKFANGAVTGAFVGMFNHGMHAQKKQKSFKSKGLAVYLYSVEMIGGKANPFKGAVAISLDVGGTLVGAEGDFGYFFVLTGEDAGNLYSFSEIAGGGGTELGVSGEIARIDFSGDPSDFKADFLYGERNKVWLGGGEGGGVSFGLAISEARGYTIRVTSVSLGFSLNAFLISPGYNKGLIK